MTTTENTEITENAEVTEDSIETAQPTAPRNATYLELAQATWKLGYRLSSWGDDDLFCVDGVNGYLRHFDLPELREVDGNWDAADSYVKVWHDFRTWTATGEVDPADDQDRRERLARSIRAYLQREQPKSRETMNEWLTELGVETIAPPAPRRHIGRYTIGYTESTEVNSARIQAALSREFPELSIRVSYDGRLV